MTVLEQQIETIDQHLSMLPEHCRAGVRRYLVQGKPPGSFLTAVFQNDLMAALRQADDINMDRLLDYPRFLINYAPPGSYGSRENYKDWLMLGGLDGLIAEAEQAGTG